MIQAQYPNIPYYHVPILEKLFRSLLTTTFTNLNLKIFEGDLLASKVNTDEIISFVDGILGVEFRTWREIDVTKLKNTIKSSTAYVVLLEGLSNHMRDYINRAFEGEKSYIGAIQIIGANSVQWTFYKQYLSPHYRYVDKELRIFYTMDEEDRDDDLEKRWKQLPFQSVQWENLNARHTIFDAYETFDHAVLLVRLNEMLSGRLVQLAEDVLLRLGDLNPQLPTTLYAAFKSFYSLQTSEDFSHVAISCRRFVEQLADTLYPPREEKVNGREVNAAKYRNRLWAYVQERINVSKQAKDLVQVSLQDLGSRIDTLYELANKGAHAEIVLLDLDRLLIGLVTVTYDLLSLAPPPMEVPVEPHLPEIYKFIKTLDEDGEE